MANKRGTIADVTKWAERVMPGDETRARSVIVTCRKAGLFTKGGHGRNAPSMKMADFATAVLAVLHPGQVTKVHDAVADYYSLPLALVSIDDPERAQPFTQKPEVVLGDDLFKPYLDRFNLNLTSRDNLIAALTLLFMEYAPHHDFFLDDQITLESSGDRVAVTIKLCGGYETDASGNFGSGPDHSAITLTFGDLHVVDRGALKVTRTLYADALNDLSMLTPNLRKGS